ncbi:hypothetical protein HCC30_23870 [Streptomyces sp. HNM0574]|nr:hypothetical protein [Streptomyces sp. HNM0574]
MLGAVTVSGCGAAEHVTAGMKAKGALETLGKQSSASFVASVDGSEEDARTFLRGVRGGEPSDRAVRLLANTEVTMAVGSGQEDIPLAEMKRSDAMDVAAALNFGRTDVFAVKSVRDKLYLRAEPANLAEQLETSDKRRHQADEIVALAEDLPDSLGSAKDALRGSWVRVDPETFDDFAQAADRLTERAGKEGAQHGPAGAALDAADAPRGTAQALRRAVSVASALNGQTQREFVERLETLLREHARFSDGGERGGAEHVKVTLPGREAAADLSAALEPLGADVPPSRVPDHDVTADLAVRRGQLTSLTVDLGQFTGAWGKEAAGKPGSGEEVPHLPLKLELGGGAALSVDPPDGARELRPEDLMASLMYGALGSTRS